MWLGAVTVRGGAIHQASGFGDPSNHITAIKRNIPNIQSISNVASFCTDLTETTSTTIALSICE
jgi:hypothetical protein